MDDRSSRSAGAKIVAFPAGARADRAEAQSGHISNAFIAQNYAPLKSKEIDSHDIKIGMRWNFGDPNCCGTPEPVAYAPPPVVRKY